MDETHCGNHFTTFVNQIIILCTLNLCSACVSPYLNKMGQRKARILESDCLVQILAPLFKRPWEHAPKPLCIYNRDTTETQHSISVK